MKTSAVKINAGKKESSGATVYSINLVKETCTTAKKLNIAPMKTGSAHYNRGMGH